MSEIIEWIHDGSSSTTGANRTLQRTRRRRSHNDDSWALERPGAIGEQLVGQFIEALALGAYSNMDKEIGYDFLSLMVLLG